MLQKGEEKMAGTNRQQQTDKTQETRPTYEDLSTNLRLAINKEVRCDLQTHEAQDAARRLTLLLDNLDTQHRIDTTAE